MNSSFVHKSLSQEARTEEREWRDWDQEMLKSGTAWMVNSTMIPRAPSERSAARNSSGFFVDEHVTNWELDSRIVREVMHSEIRPWVRLEPWVPVEMTPATD